MYEKYKFLLESKGVKTAEVSRSTGIDPATFSHWKKGKYEPKKETIQKLADYLGVPLSYFYGEEKEPSYYIDDEVAEIAQQLHDDPDLRLMFMAARDMPKEDIIAFRQLMSKWRGEDID